MKRIAVVGYGAIGRSIIEYVTTSPDDLEIVGVCLRSTQLAEARSSLANDVLVTDDMDEILALRPDVIVEAAGHDAVRAHAIAILGTGIDFHVLSVGCFADAEWLERVRSCAKASAAKIAFPAGALGGFDGLRSMKAGGLAHVTYTSIKPPLAWRGTEAEGRFDLSGLTKPTILLDGSAREAARRFPKNANLAATVAMAGLGFDETRVTLIADPAVDTNIGRINAGGPMGDLEFSLGGAGATTNPKTSMITAFSVIAAIRNEGNEFTFV